jgi:hypothetical protein
LGTITPAKILSRRKRALVEVCIPHGDQVDFEERAGA